jgi:hypothetical protein
MDQDSCINTQQWYFFEQGMKKSFISPIKKQKRKKKINQISLINPPPDATEEGDAVPTQPQ